MLPRTTQPFPPFKPSSLWPFGSRENSHHSTRDLAPEGMAARSVCVHPYSMLSVKPWVYPVHRYCTMYSLSCWDSGDSLRFIGLGDGCHSLTGQPGSHRALAFRASPRETMQLCPPVHRASLEHPSGCLGENLEDSHKPSRQCPSCVQVTTGKAPSVCSVGGRQRKEQTVGIKPLVQPFTHFARRHCNSLEFVLEFGE